MDRLPRSLATALVALAVPAALPALADAKLTTLGSDLSAPANMAETHGADSVFWQTDLAKGGSPRMPAYGQVVSIRIKGMVLASQAPGARPPLTGGNFSSLSPQRDGSVTIRERSQPVDIPSSGDPNQITTFAPEHLCVRPGEYVGFTDYGGFDPPFYPNGVPFQIFSRVPGSSTRFYTKDGGTRDGANFKGKLHEGQELLMQMVLATGSDVQFLCPRGPRRRFEGVKVHKQFAPAFVTRGYARIRSSCPADLGLCHGKMTMTTEGRGKNRKTLGRAKFSISPGNTVSVRLPLNGTFQTLAKGKERLKAIVRTSVKNSYGQRKSRKAKVRLRLLRR